MLNKVTFTGVDDRTDADELVEISRQHPFVEFGVLMSRNNTGSGEVNRFPSGETINNLCGKGLHLSAHICGNLARDAVSTGNFAPIWQFFRSLGLPNDMFCRMQLNVAGYDALKEFEYRGNIPLILQVRTDKEEEHYRWMQAKNGLVQALFDQSGGQGIRSDFELGLDAPGYVGFAGGLSRENAAFACGAICAGKYEAQRDFPGRQICQDFWLDMESSVRTDDWFDTRKIRQVCEELDAFM